MKLYESKKNKTLNCNEAVVIKMLQLHNVSLQAAKLLHYNISFFIKKFSN